MNKIKLGKYRHYKGMMYEVLGIVKHSETLEDYVHYQALYDNEIAKEWIRPLTMFLESVEVDGKLVKRFEYVEEL